MNKQARSGRVRVRYWSALARLQYSEGSAVGAPSVTDNFVWASTVIAVEWHSDVPARCRRLTVY
jgi:hypothetical protein